MPRALSPSPLLRCVLIVAVLGATLARAGPSHEQARDLQRDGAQEAPDSGRAAALIARFERELLLERPAQVLHDGRALVSAGGELARDGRAVALVARALAQTVGESEARKLLDSAQVGLATRAHVELELARLDLSLDRLREVEQRLAAERAEGEPVRFPELADSWLLLGRARQRAGREGDAARLLRVFVERWPLHPEAPAAWHMLAQAALRARSPELARSCRERAAALGAWHGYYRARLVQIEEDPRSALPHLGLAQLWSSADQPERARAALDACLALDPELARAWALLGELERRSSRPTEALAAYARALELDGALHEARFNRAALLLQAGRDVEARVEFERLIGAGAADALPLAAAHLELARILLAAGERDLALEHHALYRAAGGAEPLERPAAK